MADDAMLEELKLVAEDRRYYVSRYLQAATFYFAIAGLGFNTLLNVSDKTVLFVLTILVEVINILVFFAAGKFRDIVYHSLNRETELAKKLNHQPPHQLMWGYYLGIMIVLTIGIGFAVLLAVRYPLPCVK